MIKLYPPPMGSPIPPPSKQQITPASHRYSLSITAPTTAAISLQKSSSIIPRFAGHLVTTAICSPRLTNLNPQKQLQKSFYPTSSSSTL